MKDLIGSESQVTWANEIRARRIEQFICCIETAPTIEQREKGLKALEVIKEAMWSASSWIDTVDHSAAALVDSLAELHRHVFCEKGLQVIKERIIEEHGSFSGLSAERRERVLAMIDRASVSMVAVIESFNTVELEAVAVRMGA
jgi:hypothetical protein